MCKVKELQEFALCHRSHTKLLQKRIAHELREGLSRLALRVMICVSVHFVLHA
jgi:hypothetical protein